MRPAETRPAALVRPSVSVVVPFVGSDAELADLVRRLGALHRRPGDELIIADNRATASGAASPRGEVLVHGAGGVHSPGFARNRGAAVASGAWLLFIDADTEPAAELIDAYFDPLPDERTAILAGGIRDLAAPNPRTGRTSLAARHAAARGHMEDQITLERDQFPYAQTANCAVRRTAFVEVGGFNEEIRAGEDADLCFRLSARGWRLERRPRALVRHRTRSTALTALQQLTRHGAGAAWCNRLHPGSFPPATPRDLLARTGRAAFGVARAAARRDAEGAAFAALEAMEALAFESGRLLSNRAKR